MNILSGIITLVLLGVIGFCSFFFLLLALNGFSERDVNASFIFYTVWVIFCTLIMATAAFFITKFLIGKSWNAILSVAISVLLTVVIGTVIDFGGLIVSTIIASEVRNSYMKK